MRLLSSMSMFRIRTLLLTKPVCVLASVSSILEPALSVLIFISFTRTLRAVASFKFLWDLVSCASIILWSSSTSNNTWIICSVLSLKYYWNVSQSCSSLTMLTRLLSTITQLSFLLFFLFFNLNSSKVIIAIKITSNCCTKIFPSISLRDWFWRMKLHEFTVHVQ